MVISLSLQNLFFCMGSDKPMVQDYMAAATRIKQIVVLDLEETMPHFELARTNIEPESNCHGKAVMNGLVELCLTLLEVTI